MLAVALALGLVLGLGGTSSGTAGAVIDGHTFETDGHRLAVTCTGTAVPAVMLEAPFATTSEIWKPVVRALREELPEQRVCTYDRAQVGKSDRVGTHTIEDSVADLHALIADGIDAGPVILAGYSYGGLITRLLAARHPDDVAALVLVDSTPVGFHDQGRQYIKPSAQKEFVGTAAAEFEKVEPLDRAAARTGAESVPGSLAAPLTVIHAEGGIEVPFARSRRAARALDELVADLQRATLALSVDSDFVTVKSVHTRVLQDEPQVVAGAIAAIRARV
jgi:pimeloyl-ACP methyl ester carboxylesterase